MAITVKQMKRLICCAQFFRNFIPNLGQKLSPFYKLLRKENVFTITNDHHESFNTLKADLTRATALTLTYVQLNQASSMSSFVMLVFMVLDLWICVND